LIEIEKKKVYHVSDAIAPGDAGCGNGKYLGLSQFFLRKF
jgi:hypothetical protein